MVRVRAEKKPVLSQSLDLKVSNLVYKLLDEKTQENKKKNGDDNEDQFANIALARDLKISDALTYVQQKDLSLQRVKKVMLEKTLERIIRDIKEEEKIEMQNIIGEDDEPMDSDFEGVDVDDLMDLKEQNQMNKSVVNLWNIKPADVPSETPMDTSAETEKDEQLEMIEQVDGSIKEEKKTKKRSKDSSRPSKRQKGMLLLFQSQMNLH
jgi:ribosome biogenesis ATPase